MITMLYCCIHMATVGIKGLTYTIWCPHPTHDSSSDHIPINSGGYKGWSQGHLCDSCAPSPDVPYKIGCKVARLRNSCIRSVASHSWCQITPLTQSCIVSSEISGLPNTDVATTRRWPPQTAAARNAPDSQHIHDCLFKPIPSSLQ